MAIHACILITGNWLGGKQTNKQTCFFPLFSFPFVCVIVFGDGTQNKIKKSHFRVVVAVVSWLAEDNQPIIVNNSTGISISH